MINAARHAQRLVEIEGIITYANELNRGQGLGAVFRKRRIAPGSVLRNLRGELLALCAVFFVARLLLGNDGAASTDSNDRWHNHTSGGVAVVEEREGGQAPTLWYVGCLAMSILLLLAIVGVANCHRVRRRGKLVADMELSQIEREVFWNWFNLFPE